jgi:hypothetical protein
MSILYDVTLCVYYVCMCNFYIRRGMNNDYCILKYFRVLETYVINIISLSASNYLIGYIDLMT